MSSWRVTIDAEHNMLLDDLTEALFTDVAIKHNVNWYTLFSAPGRHPGALYDLIVCCAEQLDVEPPPQPTTIGESVKLLEYLDVLEDEDDLPKPSTSPVSLSTVVEVETENSSGSSGDSGGPQSESDTS